MKNIILLFLVSCLVLNSCKKDDDSDTISNPAEVANLMNNNLSLSHPNAFTINEDEYELDTSIQANSNAQGVAVLFPGQVMSNSISFSSPTNNVIAVGMRFGTSGPIYCVPVDSNSGVGIFDFILESGICENLSEICHDIRCYEFAITDVGTISMADIAQVAMICGNCNEPSCTGLVDPSDCDTNGGSDSGSFTTTYLNINVVDGNIICSNLYGGSATLGVGYSNEFDFLVFDYIGTSGNVEFPFYDFGCNDCPELSLVIDGDSNTEVLFQTGGTGSWSGDVFTFNGTMKRIEDITNGGGTTYTISGSFNCSF